ncbi:MAG TPA: GGDEF domain-containing protein [Sphingomicrobium sp.]|nr:GGDEF domain-containing protein [Sphingomicrobium sp.]
MHHQSPGIGQNTFERRFVLYLTLIGCVALAAVVRDIVARAGLSRGEPALFSYFAGVGADVLLVLVICTASPYFVREMKRGHVTALAAQESRRQIELLFHLTDMLQGALGHADANAVLRSTASALLPGFGGALYIFNNSGDRLELSTSWQWPEATPLSETIAPGDCWAIKRGKLHMNLVDENALCCEHQQCCVTTMEIPMMARGEIYGLLVVQRSGESASDELSNIATAVDALADAMSLSLANLALRERLRTQALRDGLTGLYNRRYMEDALERYMEQAARTQLPLSIVMIDLDHFKKLNDEHGHAMGDAVLSEAASAILGAIAATDIACRYGGEELVVLLPNCRLDEASAKAEMMRGRIERLSDRHGVSVSASFGVAAIAETSSARDVLADADKALYHAKQQGRNRVVAAPSSIRSLTAKPQSKAA